MTRKSYLFAAAFVVATGLFGAWMVTSPTLTEAAVKPGINVSQINASTNMPSFDDNYQRGTGVLDVFVGP